MQKNAGGGAAPPAEKTKKPKKAAAAAPQPPLDSSDLDLDMMGATGKTAADKRMSVERIYQKKTQLEHILLRPDTYIGSVESVTQVYSK
jgi:hypothetical protein